MANTRGNRRGSGANTGADDLLRVERDRRIVALRLENATWSTITHEVGCALSTAQDAVKRWMTEHGPASEQVNELRQIQSAKIDAMEANLAPRVMRPLRNDDGEIIYDGTGDNRKPVPVVDVPVAQLVIKLWERKARVFGLDMERAPGPGNTVPTAEALAELFGWDGQPSAIDVEAEELPTLEPAPHAI